MCILFLHTNPNPEDGEYRLVVATNRDEYYKRPAKSVYQCPETGVIAGRDMEPGREGGSWLGFVAKKFPENGKPTKYCFSCLTNLSGNPRLDNALGRGGLVINYLEGQADFPEYIKGLRKKEVVFSGFNLVGVELGKDDNVKTYYTCNEPQIDAEYSGKHTLGFGNSTISSPYMKVLHGKEKFSKILQKGLSKAALKEELLTLLKDKTKCLPDEELKRRCPNSLEPMSSIFVDCPNAGYGTRTHTIVLIDKDWNLEFTEVTMDFTKSENPEWKTNVIKINL